MPRDLASMIRFSIWSDMPRPCRPPIGVGLVDELDRVVVPLAVDGDRAAALEADGDVLGGDLHRRVPELHAHDRLDGLERDVEVLEGLGLVGGAPDVGVGGVGLLLAVAVGQVVLA